MATKKIEEINTETVENVEVTEEVKPKKRTSKAKTAEPVVEESIGEDEPVDTGKDDAMSNIAEIAEEIDADTNEDISASENEDVNKEVALKSSRFAFELAKATKKDKKNMYRSEHVITEFGDEDIVTESTQLKEDYLELVASAKSQKILEGKITGFRYAGETRKSTILADIEFGTGLFSVLIPSYLLYDYEMSKYVEPDKIIAIENNILRRIGSRVKFIVRHVDEKAKTAYADRLEAQSILGIGNYVKNTRDGRPRIFEGLIVKSQIILTTQKGITVDALGADITIKREELSHSYVGDARAEFKVGDYVNVKIGKVSEVTVEKNGTNYRLVKATGSVKDATPNRKEALFHQFKVDSIQSAEVTYIEESGVFCRLKGGVDCLCALPRFGENPRRGQQRLVRITGVDEEKLFIYGIFVNN